MPNHIHISSKQIANWATSKAAQVYLPKLIRLLIHATVTPSNCDFPAGDSTSLPGFDGELICHEETSWTPAGQSYWELSCEAEPTGKANRDYSKRTKQIDEIIRKQCVLVIVSARKWTQKKQWLKKKHEKSEWKTVYAFDADDIEQWLEQCPAVALQFAEELDISGWEVESIGKYWQSWSSQSSPRISIEAFHASREPSCEQLLQQLKSNFSSNQSIILSIKADSIEEATAFVCSVIQNQEDLAAFSLVITDLAGWRFVDKHPSLKIAIADRPEIAERLSKRDGLTIIIPSGYSINANDADITIERPDIYQFDKALVTLGFSEGEAHRIALNTGRSWSVYRRRFAENPAIRSPVWLNTKEASVLVTVCLLGSWSDSQTADKEVVSSLADRSYQEVEKDLRYLAQQDDAPVLKIGSVWKAKSTLELLDLFAERITTDELDRFFELSLQILATPAPELDLPDEQRYAAQVYGKVRPNSGLLLESLCDSLIKLAVGGSQLPSLREAQIVNRVAKLVRDLLHEVDGIRWLSLSSLLPALAEAAPDSFLRAIEWSLAQPDKPVARLIAESSNSGITGRCWHAGLLWALETLAWSPNQFPRVALILAKLINVPYSSSWSNKPMDSLMGLFRSWLPQTAATLEQRIDALDMLITKEPETAFNLLDTLVHVFPVTVMPANRPKWRNEDACFGRDVTNEDNHRMKVAAVDRLLKLADMKPQRIVCLLGKLSVFDAEYTEKTLQLIKPYAESDALDEDRDIIRTALRNVIHWQRNYSDKDEKTLNEYLIDMEHLYQNFEPQDLFVRHRWLFASAWIELPWHEEYHGSDKQAAIIEALRTDALKEIYLAFGLTGVEKLAASCGGAYWVGAIIMNLEIADTILVEWIFRRGGNFDAESFLTQIISGLFSRLGVSKVLVMIAAIIELGKLDGWSVDNIVRCLLLAPLCTETWNTVESYGSEIADTYWAKLPINFSSHDDEVSCFVIRRLLAVNRPRSALTVCRHDFTRVDVILLAEMLERFLRGEELDGPILNSWRIGKALEQLQSSSDIDKALLIRLEFSLFPALEYGQEQKAKTLYEGIMSDPSLFAELLCILYKPQNDELEQILSETEMATAKRVWHVLRACKRLPGMQADGSIHPIVLVEYIDKVRELSKEVDRLEVCDSTLGQILAHAPTDIDGIWPCQAVRDVLDRDEFEKMRKGFINGIINKRGVTTRLPTDGGGQERNLADYYRKQAQALSSSHIHLAAILEELANGYENDGQREDVDARLRREEF